MSQPNAPPKHTSNAPKTNTSQISTHKCHQCSTQIYTDPSLTSLSQTRIANANTNTVIDSANTHNPPILTLQCVHTNCEHRSLNQYKCINCSELSECRNCKMALCKHCRIQLKVLSCKYCISFICSQQCYTALLKKYFQFLEHRFGIAVKAHQSMHLFRKSLLPPHLHSNLAHIKDEDLPFHVCESCKAQNCGCIDWLSCVNCRKYYCIDCEDKVYQKCALTDCQCHTCCHKQEWDRNCDYCNRFGNCGLIFCTKGHCNRHIIINREIEYGEINNNNNGKKDEMKCESKEQMKVQNDGNDDNNDIEM